MSDANCKEFEQWIEDYALKYEPDYTKGHEIDCRAAFEAGRNSASIKAQIKYLKNKCRKLKKENLQNLGRLDASRDTIKNMSDINSGLYEALQGVINAYQCDEDINLAMSQAKIATERARGEKQ